MSINLDHLANFITAAEYRNFTAAADRLFINQSTLSRQVQSLEESLKAPLFIRNGKNLTLTKAGQLLFEAGQSLMQHADQVESLVRDAANAENSRIVIYSIPAFLEASAEAYRRLRDRGMKVEILLHHLHAEDPFALLSSDGVDFLIMFDRFRGPGDLERIPFARDGFCLVCGPGHPLAARKSVTFREAREENIIFGMGFPGLSAMSDPRTAAENAPSFRTLESHHDAVLLGEGVLLLPIVCAGTYAADLRVVPISDPDLTYTLELIYKKDRPLSPAARAYAEEIRAIGRGIFPAEG